MDLLALFLVALVVAACSGPAAPVELGATPAATASPTSPPTPTPLPTGVLLSPMNWQPETRGNHLQCSTAIVLGYYDHWISQFDVNAQIRGAQDQHQNQDQCEVVSYLRQYQLTGRILEPPSRELLRRLLANGIPSLVVQMISPDWLTEHYCVLRGYDDEAGDFIFDDPLPRLGPAHRIDYETFDDLLRPASRLIAVYPPEKEAPVTSLLQDLDVTETRCDLLRHTVALGDLDGDSDTDALVDGWAWLNDGSGGFASGRWWVGINYEYAAPSLGDLDGDGDVDALCANLHT
jgi:hypothetical protein